MVGRRRDPPRRYRPRLPSCGSHFGVQARVAPVVFEYVEIGERVRFRKAARFHEVEVVGRRVVLGILAVGRSA